VNVHLAQNLKLGNTTGFWLHTLITAHDETVSRMLDSIYKGFHAMGDSSGELKRTAASVVVKSNETGCVYGVGVEVDRGGCASRSRSGGVRGCRL
jgi:hypothetical protein